MSTLKLLLPGGKSISFGSPFKKETKRLAGISALINAISLIVVSVFALLLPVSGTLLSSDPETSTLKFLIIFIFTFLLILILKLLVQGNSFVIDPKGLLMILVFNLILTTLSITITTLRVSNTFGTTGFRYLSGLALMSLIGLFYFLNLYVLNKSTLSRILKFLIGGSVLYVIGYLLSSYQSSSQLLSNLPLLTLGFGLLVYMTLKNASKILGTFSLFVFGILVLIAIPFNTNSYASLLYYAMALLIAYILVLALYALKNKKDLKIRIKQIRANIQNFINVKKISVPTDKGLADLHLITLFILPVFIFVAGLFFYSNIPQAAKANVVTDITNNYNDSIRLITGGSYGVDSNNLRSIVMGVGSDNYNTSKPFLANVLVVSGLIGVVIYLFLWLYFIKAAKDVFIKNLREKKEFKLTGFILFFVILIPLVLMISSANLLTVVLLWIVYSVIGAFNNNTQINYLDSTIKNNSASTGIKLTKSVAALLTFVVIIYTVNLIFVVLK